MSGVFKIASYWFDIGAIRVSNQPSSNFNKNGINPVLIFPQRPYLFSIF